jgi:DNA-binding transcriptional LysR family regulator
MTMRQRRFLPSVSLLLAFEAVFRTRSTTVAARELDLTQSTVSRLVQSLEEQLKRALFVRHRKRMLPTDAAERYATEITRALDLIQHASIELSINQTGGSLSIATLPAIGTRWLAPQIGRFLADHPGITLNFATRVPRFSFEVEHFDAVMYFGEPDWPGAQHQKLFDEEMSACASAAFLEAHPLKYARDVAQLPLLHLQSRPSAWDQWFAAHYAPGPSTPGMRMDQFSVMIQAAAQGLGVALLPEYIVKSEVEEGRLVRLPFPPIGNVGSYWLAWPEAKQKYIPLVLFRDWLAARA